MATLTTQWQILTQQTFTASGGTYVVSLQGYYSDVSGSTCTVHYRLVVNASIPIQATSLSNSSVLNGTGATGQSASGGTFSLGQGDNIIHEIAASGISGGSSVSVSGGYYMGYYNWGSTSMSASADVPAFTSAPTGLTFHSCTAGPDWYDVGVSITGWGTGGSAATRYIEADIAQRDDSSIDLSHRRYAAVYDSMSSTIRIDNTSIQAGGFDIVPNTVNTVGIYATNGEASTNMVRVGNHVSAPPVMTSTLDLATTDSATISWSFGNQGGAFPLFVQYSLDGTNWTTASTQSGSGAKSGNYIITGLNPNTAYTVYTRLLRDGESGQNYTYTDGNTVSVTTEGGFYCSHNGLSKVTKKLYCSDNGSSKEVIKFYGSYNGTSKRIF